MEAKPKFRRWVLKAMAVHIQRLRISDAPEPDTEELQDAASVWDDAFQEVGATDGNVDKASRLLCRDPPKFWAEQLPAILKAIETVKGDNFAQGPGGEVDVSREAAALGSRDCRVCEGYGLAIVYHRDYRGDPIIRTVNSDGTASAIQGRFAMYCICPLGRWLIGANRRGAFNPKLDSREREARLTEVRRMDWLGVVIAGQTAYQIEDPRYK